MEECGPCPLLIFFFHSCTVHLDAIESFIYPTDAQLDCSESVKIYIKIYMRGAPTCFCFSRPSSGSYCMCFAEVVSINNQLNYVVYRQSYSAQCTTHTHTHTHTNTDWINMQPLDRTDEPVPVDARSKA